MKYLLIIGDGMADDPVPELGGRTPLEAANKPNMDALAAKGIQGTAKTVPEGVPAGSDTALLSIFGCDPRACYTGRSPLEAAGAGVPLRPGEISYRCNLVALEEEGAFENKKILSHNAGSIEGEEALALVAALFSDAEWKRLADEAEIKLYPSPSFRQIAVQRGAALEGLRATPPHDILGERIGEYLPKGSPNADRLKELMKKANGVLALDPVNQKRRKEGKLPGNGIWFWAEGMAAALPPFESRFHKTGAIVSAVPLARGIARLIGLEAVIVEGATGELETNYEGKVAAAAAALKNGCDFAAIHIEAPDECTHNGDLTGKVRAIEYIDARVVKPVLEALKDAGISEYRLLILSDHRTLMSTRSHDAGPVPCLFYERGIDTKSGLTFSERNGEKGEHLAEGTELLQKLFEKA